jgi:putative peptidoglycan lipid II flippase
MSASVVKSTLQKIFSKDILKSKLLAKTFKLVFITMFANILGFLVPVYIANTYGVTKHTDAFLFSYSIINFVGVIFSTSVSAACVPFLKERMHDMPKFEEFTSTVFYYIIKYIGALAVVAFVVVFTISRFVSSDFLFYLSISVPIFFFIVLNAFYYGILNSLNQFNLAATSPFSRAIIIFATIYFFHSKLGISSAILGYNLGEFAKFLHLTYVIRYKNKIILSLSKRQPSVVKGFLKAGSFQALSSTIAASSPLCDKIVASFLALGTISMLDYGDKMFMVFNVMLTSFLTIMLSKWSADVTKNRFKKAELNKIVLLMMSATFGLCIVIFIVRLPIVNFLYPKLKIDNREKIAMLLTINMLGFVFNSATQIINRAVIAFKATKILVKMSVLRLAMNFVLDIVLVYKFGIYGIVAATVITNIVCLGTVYTLFTMFKNKLNQSVAIA